MNVTLKVPSIACEVCAKTITNAILAVDNQAQVNVNVEQKLVTVISEQEIATIKEAISDAGHDLES